MRELGIFSWFGYELGLDKRLSLIVHAGFQSTCLWLGKAEAMVANSNEGKMVALATQFGLSVDNVHAPYDNCNFIWSNSSEERKLIEAEYKSCLQYCNQHEIPILVIHITKGANPPQKSEIGIGLIDHLGVVAKELDVVLALENTGRPDYIDFVLSHLSSPNIAFCYDSSHDFLKSEYPGRILQKWGHCLVATHLSDNNGASDNHWLPGEGNIDWTAISESFPSENYCGSIILEVLPKNRDMSAEMFLSAAHTIAVRLRKDLGLTRRCTGRR